MMHCLMIRGCFSVLQGIVRLEFSDEETRSEMQGVLPTSLNKKPPPLYPSDRTVFDTRRRRTFMVHTVETVRYGNVEVSFDSTPPPRDHHARAHKSSQRKSKRCPANYTDCKFGAIRDSVRLLLKPDLFMSSSRILRRLKKPD